jgi:hypothetical protein
MKQSKKWKKITKDTDSLQAGSSGLPSEIPMIYTNKFDNKLIETHWLASVSHHHYWFADFAELVEFQNSPQFDLRMIVSSPQA